MEIGFRRFQRRLFARRDDGAWHLVSGSLYERPLPYVLQDPTDLDDLMYPDDLCAIPPGKPVPPRFRSARIVLTVFTDGVHPGFAKLQTELKTFYRIERLADVYTSTTGNFKIIPNGASMKRCAGELPEKLHGCPLKDVYQVVGAFGHLKPMTADRVEAIFCPYWPSEAEEWCTRTRSNGWPTDETVKKIVQGGCHFVSKPHQSNPEDSSQWRFSFSFAEFILVHSWTDVRKYIYHLLRLIKNAVVSSCGGEDSTALCTYFFKTLMLWACEEKSSEFWSEENLENSLSELLTQMIEWLIERHCPNYFIPGNNMIDHLADDVNLSKEISALLYFRENCINSMLNKVPKAYSGAEFQVSIPYKFRRYFQLLLCYLNIIDPLDSKLTERFMKRLCGSSELMHEMKYIYLGIVAHLKLIRSPNENRWRKSDTVFSSMALRYFNLAIKYHNEEPNDFSLELTSSDSLLTAVEKLMSENSHTTGNENTRISHSDDSRSYGFAILCKMAENLMRNIDKEIPSLCYFVAAAYRANFLYAALKDYRSAVKQCEEAIEWIDRQDNSVSDDSLLKFLLNFIITSEWAGLFDKDIQTVFGFVTLYRKVFKDCCKSNAPCVYPYGSERNVVFHLDACEFLKYIRHRCLLQLGNEEASFQICGASGLNINSLFIDAGIEKCSNAFFSAGVRVSKTNTL